MSLSVATACIDGIKGRCMYMHTCKENAYTKLFIIILL
jgi:hypothetical protein